MQAPLLRSLPLPLQRSMVPAENALIVDARIVNPLTEPEWDSWIETHPGATIFHTAAWARVLVETYNHRPCYLRIAAQGELLALVPIIEVQSLLTRSRGVCLPFSDSCDPLLFNRFGAEAVTRKLRQVTHEREWSYLELRGDSVVPDGAPISESYYGNDLNLRGGEAAIFENFSSATRRAIRKVQQHGLSASIHTSLGALNHFCDLHARTRRRHGVPPQPRLFFKKIQQHILNAGLGFIVLIKSAERVVAAAMFFKFQSRAIYKFGASDERFLRLRGNNLAMWEAIRYLAQSGAEQLDFGRTNMANDGLRRFKQSWGTTEKVIRYFKFHTAADRWVSSSPNTSTLPNRVFRALPLTINRLAGAMLYPHLD